MAYHSDIHNFKDIQIIKETRPMAYKSSAMETGGILTIVI